MCFGTIEKKQFGTIEKKQSRPPTEQSRRQQETSSSGRRWLHQLWFEVWNTDTGS
jgi:hypothetical protein